MQTAFFKAIAVAAWTAAALYSPICAAQAPDCPNDGTVRFGAEPYESVAKLVPVYKNLGKILAKAIDCKVEVVITTNYTAEIEAMRHGKLEVAEFGPFGYVLAHKVAGAEAVAAFSNSHGQPATYYASIVTWPGSGITTIKQVAGHTFAYSDPASTSGHLFPSYGLSKAGIDPDHGVKAIYAGSHTQSFEALRHHKVEAGELNSEQIEAARNANEYDAKAYVTLWKSDPIPLDPITVSKSLKEPFKSRLTAALQHLDYSGLPEKDRKVLMGGGMHLLPQTDGAYDLIRDLVKTLHIDLNKMS